MYLILGLKWRTSEEVGHFRNVVRIVIDFETKIYVEIKKYIYVIQYMQRNKYFEGKEYSFL